MVRIQPSRQIQHRSKVLKELFIKDLPKDGQAALFAVATIKDAKETKTGKPYLNVTLADKTGTLDAKLWDEVDALGSLFKVNDVVKVLGDVGEYRGKPQFTIKKLRLALPEEVERGDYVPCSEKNIDDMLEEVLAYVDGVGNPWIQGVLRSILADPLIADKIKETPAAMKVHHGFVGGLLEHVCSLLELGDKICDHYQHLDKDLIRAACILHDICKCLELEVAMKISYTVEGQMIGHVAMGYHLFNKHCDLVADFPPDVRLKIGHMIISHHGKFEWGALKLPSFPEAAAFHAMDSLDAHLEQFKENIGQGEDENFSPWVGSLGLQIYKK